MNAPKSKMLPFELLNKPELFNPNEKEEEKEKPFRSNIQKHKREKK
jgi:hypothetical protein